MGIAATEMAVSQENEKKPTSGFDMINSHMNLVENTFEKIGHEIDI